MREVQAAVAAGRADAAVHSAKDLQPVPTPGLRLAAVPAPEDARDALVGRRLADLATGAVVATGSQRRRAQLAWLRPDLAFEDLRGNIATRLSEVPQGGAVVVALAALVRLGLLDDVVTEVLATDVRCSPRWRRAPWPWNAARTTMPAPSCWRRWGTPFRAGWSTPSEPSWQRSEEAATSRSRLTRLSCPSSELRLEGLLASPDGTALVRRSATGPATGPVPLGQEVARLVLAAGGQTLLSDRWGRV